MKQPFSLCIAMFLLLGSSAVSANDPILITTALFQGEQTLEIPNFYGTLDRDEIVSVMSNGDVYEAEFENGLKLTIYGLDISLRTFVDVVLMQGVISDEDTFNITWVNKM